MLCSLCSSIRFAATDPQLPSAELMGKHHRSVTELESSAVSGCQLCQVLFRHAASKAVRSRGVAQGFPGDSLIDLDQIYYAACDNPVPYYYARVPVRGVTGIEFFREGERSDLKNEHRFFVSLELFAQHGNPPICSSVYNPS